MQPTTLLVRLTGLVTASKPGLCYVMQHYTGVAAFNDFARQSNTNCGPKTGMFNTCLPFSCFFFVPHISKPNQSSYRVKGTYGAAVISGGTCSGRVDMNLCHGQFPRDGYIPPQCPRGNCGMCYKVTNIGGYNGSQIGGIGNSIIVQIIDSCPSANAWNFCKTNVPEDERCCSRATNAMNIDQSAYGALTGQDFGNVSIFSSRSSLRVTSS